jgi:hypothetical protein
VGQSCGAEALLGDLKARVLRAQEGFLGHANPVVLDLGVGFPNVGLAQMGGVALSRDTLLTTLLANSLGSRGFESSISGIRYRKSRIAG